MLLLMMMATELAVKYLYLELLINRIFDDEKMDSEVFDSHLVYFPNNRKLLIDFSRKIDLI